jgi:hypothetical protein
MLIADSTELYPSQFFKRADLVLSVPITRIENNKDRRRKCSEVMDMFMANKHTVMILWQYTALQAHRVSVH